MAFFSEVERGDIETVRAMVAAAPALVRARDAELAERLVTRHPSLRSAVDRDGTSLADHAASAADPALGRLFGR